MVTVGGGTSDWEHFSSGHLSGCNAGHVLCTLHICMSKIKRFMGTSRTSIRPSVVRKFVLFNRPTDLI